MKENENNKKQSNTAEKGYDPKMKSKKQLLKINVLPNQENVNVQVANITKK